MRAVRFGLGAFVAASAVTATCVRVSADEAADLFAKHRAFVGWQLEDGSVHTLVQHGAIVRRDREGGQTELDRITVVRSGLAYRSTVTAIKGGRSTHNGFTGSRFWHATDNGFTVPIAGDERYDLLAEDLVFAEGFSKLPASVRRHDVVGGVPVVVLRATPPSGPPLDLYLDGATGALRRFVTDPDANPNTIDIDAYADFAPGKRYISEYHTEGSSLFRRYTETTANGAIAPSDLEPPPQRARWTFAKGGHIPIKVTDNRIYIDAAVNGVPGHFILDTGASVIAFSDRFTDRIHMKREESAVFGGIGGGKRGSFGMVDRIQFADGSTLEKVRVSSGVNLGSEADGLIGFDFLAGAIVDVDLDASQITLYDPKLAEPNESAGLVAVADLSGGVPIVPVKLNTTTTSHALLDSGASGDVLLSHAFIGRLRMLVDNTRLSSLEFVGGIGGYEADRCGFLTNVVLGAITYQSPRACYSFSLSRDESLVGIHFMKYFNITFDYPDAKIVLAPRKQ